MSMAPMSRRPPYREGWVARLGAAAMWLGMWAYLAARAWESHTRRGRR